MHLIVVQLRGRYFVQYCFGEGKFLYACITLLEIQTVPDGENNTAHSKY